MPHPSLNRFRLAVIQVLPIYTSFLESKGPTFHHWHVLSFPKMNSCALPLTWVAPDRASWHIAEEGLHRPSEKSSNRLSPP